MAAEAFNRRSNGTGLRFLPRTQPRRSSFLSPASFLRAQVGALCDGSNLKACPMPLALLHLVAGVPLPVITIVAAGVVVVVAQVQKAWLGIEDGPAHGQEWEGPAPPLLGRWQQHIGGEDQAQQQHEVQAVEEELALNAQLNAGIAITQVRCLAAAMTVGFCAALSLPRAPALPVRRWWLLPGDCGPGAGGVTAPTSSSLPPGHPTSSTPLCPVSSASIPRQAPDTTMEPTGSHAGPPARGHQLAGWLQPMWDHAARPHGPSGPHASAPTRLWWSVSQRAQRCPGLSAGGQADRASPAGRRACPALWCRGPRHLPPLGEWLGLSWAGGMLTRWVRIAHMWPLHFHPAMQEFHRFKLCNMQICGPHIRRQAAPPTSRLAGCRAPLPGYGL